MGGAVPRRQLLARSNARPWHVAPSEWTRFVCRLVQRYCLASERGGEEKREREEGDRETSGDSRGGGSGGGTVFLVVYVALVAP